MQKIQSVTLPRSGHHLLVNCLIGYFENFNYCNFYGCCKSLTCDKNPVFQKNHDIPIHDTKDKEVLPYLNPDSDIPYIIQYRKDAQSQMNAMYRNIRMKGIFGKNKRVSETEIRPFLDMQDYKKFCYENRYYYHHFIQKWLVYNNNPKAYFLEYYDFLERPEFHLSNIIKIFDDEINAEKLKNVIQSINIALRYDLSTCPLYQEDFNNLHGFVDPPKK